MKRACLLSGLIFATMLLSMATGNNTNVIEGYSNHNVVMIPLRSIVEYVGAILSYDSKKNKINIKYNSKDIIYHISTEEFFDTRERYEVHIVKHNGVAFIRLCDTPHLFSIDAVWNQTTNTVMICRRYSDDCLTIPITAHYYPMNDVVNINNDTRSDMGSQKLSSASTDEIPIKVMAAEGPRNDSTLFQGPIHGCSVKHLVVTPDGKQLISLGIFGGSATILNLPEGTLYGRIAENKDWATIKSGDGRQVSVEAISTSANYFATGCYLTGKHTINQEYKASIDIWKYPNLVHYYTINEADVDSVQDIVISSNETILAVNGIGIVKLRRLSDGMPLMTIYCSTSSNAIAMSYDGKILATGAFDATQRFDTPIQLWNIPEGKLIRTIKTGHACSVNALAFSHDNSTLISGGGGKDNNIRVWEVSSGKLLTQMLGHINYTSALLISQDDKAVISAGNDNYIMEWLLSDGSLQKAIRAQGYNKVNGINSLAYIPNTNILVSGSFDGYAKFWSLQSTDNNNPDIDSTSLAKIYATSTMNPIDKEANDWYNTGRSLLIKSMPILASDLTFLSGNNIQSERLNIPGNPDIAIILFLPQPGDEVASIDKLKFHEKMTFNENGKLRFSKALDALNRAAQMGNVNAIKLLQWLPK